MAALKLTVETYLDKVHGAWLGKSIGITLGASTRGQLISSFRDYYVPVPGQPVASIALDIPLVWLQTLESLGVRPSPEEMAIAWLDHLDYSQEELGYATLNLQRGLPPPASGAYSNWFRDSAMGMARADFWALLAPGSPQLAANYAYQDATIDHAEEGEWAAMFLAGVMSAAFFISDTFTLLTIGLAMIPRTSRTARAVKAALTAGQRGAAWFEARESVLIECGSKNFSDVAPNIGFFTIGMLYGLNDFGDSVCAAVNCGYDSEAVGSAIGALMGIRYGKSQIPEHWAKPIGDLLIPGVGLRCEGLPLTLQAVAERTVALGRRVITERGIDLEITEPQTAESVPPAPSLWQELAPSDTSPEEAPSIAIEPALPISAPTAEEGDEATIESVQEEMASTSVPEPVPEPIEEPTPDIVSVIAWADNTLVKPLLVTNPNAQVHLVNGYQVTLNCDSPTIAYNQIKVVGISIRNSNQEPFMGKIALLAPNKWQAKAPNGMGQRQVIAAETGSFYGEFSLLVQEGVGRVEISNSVVVQLTPEQGEPFTAEFLLLGAACWWTVGPFANFDGEGFDRTYLPEDRPGLQESYVARTMQQVTWEKRIFTNTVLEIEPLFKGSSGVCYGQTVLRCPESRTARLVANTNSGVKVWLNRTAVLRRHHREVFRPHIGSGNWATDVDLKAGDNVVMVKWVRGSDPLQFSLTLTDREGHGIPEIGNTSW